MVAPLAPHIAEELWSRLGHDETLTYVAVPGRPTRRCWSRSTVTCVMQVAGQGARPDRGAAVDRRGRAARAGAGVRGRAAGPGRPGGPHGRSCGRRSWSTSSRRDLRRAWSRACARDRRRSSPTRRLPAGRAGRASAASRWCRCRSSSAARRTTRAPTRRRATVAEALRTLAAGDDVAARRRRRSAAAYERGGRGRLRRRSCRCTCPRRCPARASRRGWRPSEAPVPVEVVDSRSLGMGMGYAVLSAAEAAAAGGVDRRGRRRRPRKRAAASMAVFYVDTLEHLRRGGRIGAAAALLGSALAVKPLLQLVDGHIEPLEKVRTSAKAIARLEEVAVERWPATRTGRHRRAPPREPRPGQTAGRPAARAGARGWATCTSARSAPSWAPTSGRGCSRSWSPRADCSAVVHSGRSLTRSSTGRAGRPCAPVRAA